jgi:putative copper resistance protein D
MTDGWFIAARTAHFAACLLLFGFFAFDRFVAARVAGGGSEVTEFWQARLRLFGAILPPVILLSGAAWFVAVTMTMSGLPLGWSLRWMMETVWSQTEFGTVWKIRLIFCVGSGVVGAMSLFVKLQPALRSLCAWLQFAAGALLLGSLAWAGHGQAGPSWHLWADVLHLLVAGLWPTGLLPFAMLLRRLRREPAARTGLITALVSRFSALSLGSVALLVATGLINSLVLVGTVSNLFTQPYGRWLLCKIILFCGAVALGAVNLLRLKPRLLAEIPPADNALALARLQASVHWELAFNAVIIVVVAVLGTLPPAH